MSLTLLQFEDFNLKYKFISQQKNANNFEQFPRTANNPIFILKHLETFI